MNPFDEDNFAHAVSFDLHTGWQKQAFALTTDESVGEVHLWAPHIIFHDGLYYMFYCAGGKSGAEYHIKLAVSEDLYHWKKHAENPMVIDGYDARDPFIYRDNEKWRMYYTATTSPKGGNHIVAAVESDDLIHWTNRKIVFTDDSTGTWGGPTESPTVIKRGDSYYLFIGPRDDYRGTCVYKSNNLLEFKKENLVGKIASHAAEVVRDLDENWYVSHSGWGQGGVYLAPLKWNAGNDDKAASLEAPFRITATKCLQAGSAKWSQWHGERLWNLSIRPALCRKPIYRNGRLK
jgi:beta-fructofuranosidase